MSADDVTPVTALLAAWRRGIPEAESRLIEAVQSRLRRMAGSYLRRERPGHTLQPTALVNEAYLRLVGQHQLDWQSRGQFFAVAAREMRRILVDHARKHRAAKRQGFAGQRISVSDVPDPADAEPIDVLSLHEALLALARLDRRQADFVEQRYFGGVTIADLAAGAGVSESTVKRELTTAKLWLRRQMAGRRTP